MQFTKHKSCCAFVGNLFLKLERHKEAEEKYRDLLRRNPENTGYYSKLEEALQLTAPVEKLEMLYEYREKFPRALAPARLLLNYASGKIFCAIANFFI